MWGGGRRGADTEWEKKRGIERERGRGSDGKRIEAEGTGEEKQEGVEEKNT